MILRVVTEVRRVRVAKIRRRPGAGALPVEPTPLRLLRDAAGFGISDFMHQLFSASALDGLASGAIAPRWAITQGCVSGEIAAQLTANRGLAEAAGRTFGSRPQRRNSKAKMRYPKKLKATSATVAAATAMTGLTPAVTSAEYSAKFNSADTVATPR